MALVTRRTQAELLAGLRRTVTRPAIVIERLAMDLTEPRPDSDHDFDSIGCIFDSGTGRCDGAYQHKGRLHYRVEGDEIWESP